MNPFTISIFGAPIFNSFCAIFSLDFGLNIIALVLLILTLSLFFLQYRPYIYVLLMLVPCYLHKLVKNNGPNVVPWGTLYSMGRYSDNISLTVTHWTLSDWYDFINNNSVSSTLVWFMVFIKMLRFTLSNDINGCNIFVLIQWFVVVDCMDGSFIFSKTELCIVVL